MEEIIINDCNLTEEDMSMSVIRVKGLIINSKGKILLAHNNNTYQFPGGHAEENESTDECILREIKEETGISVGIQERPFLCISTFDPNYFGTGKKVLNRIYYYRFMTDDTPNIQETHYDGLELASDFNLFYINYTDLKSFLKNCIKEGTIDVNIGREMLNVVNVYDKVYGGSL